MVTTDYIHPDSPIGCFVCLCMTASCFLLTRRHTHNHTAYLHPTPNQILVVPTGLAVWVCLRTPSRPACPSDKRVATMASSLTFECPQVYVRCCGFNFINSVVILEEFVCPLTHGRLHSIVVPMQHRGSEIDPKDQSSNACFNLTQIWQQTRKLG